MNYTPSDLHAMSGQIIRQAEQAELILKNAQSLLDNIQNSWRKPELRYKSASVVDIVSKPGEDNDFSFTLQDGNTYEAIVPAEFNLDTDLISGVKQPNTYYYIYHMPADATSLTAKGCTEDPDIGPSGFTSHKYIGTILTDAKAEIVNFTTTKNGCIVHSTKLIERLKNEDMKVGSSAVAVSLNMLPKTASIAMLRGIVESDDLDGGLVNFYVDGSQNKVSIASIYSRYNADQSPLSFDMPIVDVNNPRLYRRISNFRKCEYCQYQLLLTGWIDRYV